MSATYYLIVRGEGGERAEMEGLFYMYKRSLYFFIDIGIFYFYFLYRKMSQTK